MGDIDYEALAKDIRANCMFDCPVGVVTARAVVAAYREQMKARGVVEVRKDVISELCSGYGGYRDNPEYLEARSVEDGR